jgi:hypothetical protein
LGSTIYRRVSKMLAATQELSRLLPTPEPAPRRDGTSARERLRAIVLAAIEADRANGEVPEVEVLRRQVGELQAELIHLRAVMSGQVKMLPAPPRRQCQTRVGKIPQPKKGKAKHVKRANDGGAEDSAATPAPPSPQPPVARIGAETRVAQQRLAADKSVEFQHLRPRGNEPWRPFVDSSSGTLGARSAASAADTRAERWRGLPCASRRG